MAAYTQRVERASGGGEGGFWRSARVKGAIGWNMCWTWRCGSSGHRSHLERWCSTGSPFCQKLSRGEISPPVDLSADPRPAQRNVSWTWRRRSRNISQPWRGWDLALEHRFRLVKRVGLFRDEAAVGWSSRTLSRFPLGEGREEITGSGQPWAGTGEDLAGPLTPCPALVRADHARR